MLAPVEVDTLVLSDAEARPESVSTKGDHKVFGITNPNESDMTQNKTLLVQLFSKLLDNQTYVSFCFHYQNHYAVKKHSSKTQL